MTKKRILISLLVLTITYLLFLNPQRENNYPLVHLCLMEDTSILVIGTNSSARYLRKVEQSVSHDTLYLDVYTMSMFNFFLSHKKNAQEKIDLKNYPSVKKVCFCDIVIDISQVHQCTGIWGR